jgi:putative flippase GtrA
VQPAPADPAGGGAPAARRSTFWEWVRHHASSVVTTAVDYAVMVACVELAHLRPVPATVVAALVGALTNFTINRSFTYHATAGALGGHAWRYALVSAASLGLNAAGEGLFNGVLGLQYLLARVITSTIVSNAWNYPMQRFFVFSRRAPPERPPA